jgi:hypothetical protein
VLRLSVAQGGRELQADVQPGQAQGRRPGDSAA